VQAGRRRNRLVNNVVILHFLLIVFHIRCSICKKPSLRFKSDSLLLFAIIVFFPLYHSGLVKRRWQPLVRSQRCSIELVLKGNFLEIKNEVKVVKSTVNEELNEDFKRFWVKHATAPLQGRNIILSSFCPQV